MGETCCLEVQIAYFVFIISVTVAYHYPFYEQSRKFHLGAV
jgi:hypothetical protein